MHKKIMGWDIGGAHVKVAVLNFQGEVIAVRQQVCPLWQGIEQLDNALSILLACLPSAEYHCVTMTGELADCFASRAQGVAAILDAMTKQIAPERLFVYASHYGLLPLSAVTQQHTLSIASVNWLASVTVAAFYSQNALLVDVGSTTTDMLLINNYHLNIIGYTDYDRLISGELLYTGVVRSSVACLCQEAMFNGQHMGLMTEYFANMADVYRLTGDLQPEHDQTATADGADKTLTASARRLSRLTGYEFDQADSALWVTFAEHLKLRHKQKIWLNCRQQLNRKPKLSTPLLIGAGIGRFLVQELAMEHHLQYQDFNQFFITQLTTTDLTPADCAPAVAVAFLGGGFGEMPALG